MTTRRDFLGCLAAPLLLSGTGAAQTEDQEFSERWPRYGYDVGATNYAPSNSAPGGTLREVWTTTLKQSLHWLPAVDEEALYVPEDDGAIREVSRVTGDIGWVYDDDAANYQVTVAGDTLYVCGFNGTAQGAFVTALDTADGTERWYNEYTYSPNGPPVVVDGTVYVSTVYAEGRIHALDTATGTRRWRSELGVSLSTPPCYEDGRLFVCSHEGTVHGVDAGTGEELWVAQAGEDISADPTVADGTVYVSSLDGSVYAFDAASGDQLWRHETRGLGAGAGHSPAVAGNVAYVGDQNGVLYALATDTGDIEWEVQLDERIFAVIVTDGLVYVPAGDLHVFGVDDHTNHWRYETSEDKRVRSPIVADERVYLRVGTNELRTLEADPQAGDDSGDGDGQDSNDGDGADDDGGGQDTGNESQGGTDQGESDSEGTDNRGDGTIDWEQNALFAIPGVGAVLFILGVLRRRRKDDDDDDDP